MIIIAQKMQNPMDHAEDDLLLDAGLKPPGVGLGHLRGNNDLASRRPAFRWKSQDISRVVMSQKLTVQFSDPRVIHKNKHKVSVGDLFALKDLTYRRLETRLWERDLRLQVLDFDIHWHV